MRLTFVACFFFLFSNSILAQETVVSEKLERLIEEANFARLNCEYSGAINGYKEYLNYKDNDEVFRLLAQCYFQVDQYDLALEAINQSIKLNPTNDKSFYLRANILFDLGETYTSINDYTASILLNPNDMYSYMQRAFAFASLNMHDEAVRDFAIAIQINAADAKAFFNMANIEGFQNNKEENICVVLPSLAANNNFHAQLVISTFCI